MSRKPKERKSYGTQGQILHRQTRELLANVMTFMKEEAEHGLKLPLANFKQRMLLATGVSEKTYRNILKEKQDVALGKASGFSTPPRHQRGTKKAQSHAASKIMASNSGNEITFEEMRELAKNQSVVLVDVRDPHELSETGTIPGTINIPLASLEDSLGDTSANIFYDLHGIMKPTLESPIVFHCRSGRRSLIALQTAIKLGFQSVKHYPGGWIEWEQLYKEHKN